jgi:type II secretory pathway component GspD/PulD (secretin)
LTAAVLLAVLPLTAHALDTEIIQVHYRNAQELVSIASPMLSPSGRISADARTNVLIVIDTPEAIERIAGLVQQLDRQPVRLRIDVRFGQRRSAAAQASGVDGRLSGDGWEVSTGDGAEEGIRVRLQNRTRRENKTARVSVTTVSGRPAYIRYGSEVPYRERQAGVCRRYGGCPTAVTFHRVETGFWVTPQLAGDRIDLTIDPQISDLASGKRVRFAAASTHLVVDGGRWVQIGGGDERTGAALTEILGVADGEKTTAFSIFLRVERLAGKDGAKGTGQ